MAFRRYTRLLALAPLLGLLSCQNLAELLGLSDPFALYRNPADNFIAASDLDRQDLTSTGFEGTAVWTWAWRGASDARDDSNPAGYPYMKLEPAGTVTAGSLEGVDHDVPAYRLGLVNLITGGDFEGANSSTAALAANGWKWKEDPASTDYNDLKAFEPTVTIGASGEHAISGNTLMVHVFGLPLGKNPVAFRYALASLAEAKGAMVSHTYSLRLLSGTGAEFYWQTAPTGTINYDATTYVKTTAKAEYVFPDFTWNPLAFADLVFGKPTTPFDFWFDNLRIIRTDIASDYRLRLLLKPKDTAPDLVHGRGWKYTLWIRKPPWPALPQRGRCRRTLRSPVRLAQDHANRDLGAGCGNSCQRYCQRGAIERSVDQAGTPYHERFKHPGLPDLERIGCPGTLHLSLRLQVAHGRHRRDSRSRTPLQPQQSMVGDLT